jgi:hypothetical protein
MFYIGMPILVPHQHHQFSPICYSLFLQERQLHFNPYTAHPITVNHPPDALAAHSLLPAQLPAAPHPGLALLLPPRHAASWLEHQSPHEAAPLGPFPYCWQLPWWLGAHDAQPLVEPRHWLALHGGLQQYTVQKNRYNVKVPLQHSIVNQSTQPTGSGFAAQLQELIWACPCLWVIATATNCMH